MAEGRSNRTGLVAEKVQRSDSDLCKVLFFFTAVSSCRQPDLSLLEASPQHISYAAKHQESRSDGSRRLRGHEAYHPRTGLESLENDKDQVSSAEAACGGVGVWKVHYRPYAQGKEEDVG